MKAALVFLSLGALIAASGAFAATPQEIYRDYADNGRLDGTYSPADLQRALKNAAVEQYGKPTTGGLKPAVEEETGGSTAGGTAGGQASEGASPVQSSGGLPFTGLDLTLIVLGALGLIMLGAALRRVAKQRA
jgi:hypothetical protein